MARRDAAELLLISCDGLGVPRRVWYARMRPCRGMILDLREHKR